MRCSIAYALGTGTLALLMFYFSYLGGTINFSNGFLLSLPFIMYFIYYSLKKSKRGVFTDPLFSTTGSKGIIHYFFLALIVTGLFIILFRTLWLPMHLADEIAQWGIKSKILYHEGTIYAQDFFDPSRLMYHASYPFLVPLLESICFSAMGEMNDHWVKLPFPLFFLALLLFFYSAQKRWSDRGHALMFTAVLAVLPIFISNGHGNPSSGYADIPLTLYYTISVVSLCFWITEDSMKDLLLATACMTFAIFTKKEGLILWSITVLVLTIYLPFTRGKGLGRIIIQEGTFILVPLIMLLPWFHFYSTINVNPWEKDFQLSYLSYEQIYANLYRVPAISRSLLSSFFTPRYFNFLWVLFFATVVFSFKDSFSCPRSFLLLVLLLNIAVLFFAIVIYPWSWWENFLYDLPRLLMVNVPIATYFVSYQLCKSNHSYT
jgi:hypothetical protein